MFEYVAAASAASAAHQFRRLINNRNYDLARDLLLAYGYLYGNTTAYQNMCTMLRKAVNK